MMLNSRVEILHVIGAFCSGGAEWFVVNLLRSMKEKGISVGLLVLSSRRDEAGKLMFELLENEGIPFEFGPTEKVRFRSTFWYAKKIKDIKPEIVHLHTINTELIHYFANKLLSSSCVIFRTLHSTVFTKKKLYLHALWKNPAMVSIACSDSVKQVCRQYVQGDVLTVKNGVKFDWPIKTEENTKQIRSHLSLNNDVIHFMSVGRLEGDSLELAPKGHDVLIKAWKRAEMGNKKCQLHILGDGNLRNELENLAVDDKSIIFHGVKSNVHDWLLGADYFVMTSRYEGLPIAGIEALGTGLFCLFSKIPPLLELGSPAVLWSETNGIIELAANMIKIHDSGFVVPLNETEKIRQKFGIEKTVLSYVNLYQKVEVLQY